MLTFRPSREFFTDADETTKQRAVISFILNFGLLVSLFSLISVPPAFTGSLAIYGRNELITHCNSYLPCYCDDFSQKIAKLSLRLIRAPLEMIDHPSLLTLPMLQQHPPSPSQVVTLCGSPNTRLRTQSACQHHKQLQIIVSVHLVLPSNSHLCEFVSILPDVR